MAQPVAQLSPIARVQIDLAADTRIEEENIPTMQQTSRSLRSRSGLPCGSKVRRGLQVGKTIFACFRVARLQGSLRSHQQAGDAPACSNGMAVASLLPANARNCFLRSRFLAFADIRSAHAICLLCAHITDLALASLALGAPMRLQNAQGAPSLQKSFRAFPGRAPSGVATLLSGGARPSNVLQDCGWNCAYVCKQANRPPTASGSPACTRALR